jgi:hypothetical protein
MAKELTSTDIGQVPELLRTVEEVRETGEPRILRRDDEDLAVLTPVRPKSRRRSGRHVPTEADWEAFRSSAGGWSDLDTDTLVKNIYESRDRSIRPPVEL